MKKYKIYKRNHDFFDFKIPLNTLLERRISGNIDRVIGHFEIKDQIVIRLTPGWTFTTITGVNVDFIHPNYKNIKSYSHDMCGYLLVDKNNNDDVGWDYKDTVELFKII